MGRKKVWLLSLLFLLFVSNYSFAGLIDGFEDGDYTAAPVWTASTDCGGSFAVQGTTVKVGTKAVTGTHAGACGGFNFLTTPYTFSNPSDSNSFSSWVRMSGVAPRADFGLIIGGSQEVYSIFRVGINWTIVSRDTGGLLNGITGSTATSVDTWYNVKIDLNQTGARFRLFNSSDVLLETIHQMGTNSNPATLFIGTGTVGAGGGTEIFDEVETSILLSNILFDLNNLSAKTFTTNSVPVRFSLRDVNSYCTSYSVDLNNFSESDTNLLNRFNLNNLVVHDQNYVFIPRKTLNNRANLKVTAVCNNLPTLFDSMDYNFNLNLYDLNTTLTNYGTFDTNNFVNDLNVRVDYRCGYVNYDTNYYSISKGLLGVGADVNKFTQLLTCNNVNNNFTYRYSSPVATKFNFKSFFNPIYPVDQNNYFDFNGYQSLAFDNNRYWSIGNDSNSIKIDSNKDFIFKGSYALKVDTNFSKDLTTLISRVNYNPPSTWNLRDFNTGLIQGWFCTPNINLFADSTNFGTSLGASNINARTLEINLFDKNTNRSLSFDWNRVTNPILNGCSFVRANLSNPASFSSALINGISILDWNETDQFNIIVRDDNANFSSWWLDGWEIVKGDQRSDLNFFVDLNAPTITLFDHNSSFGFRADTNGTARLQCGDSTGSALYDYNTVNYTIAANGINYFQSDRNKTATVSQTIPFVNGSNTFVGTCRDLAFNSTSQTDTNQNIRVFNFALIDEDTGLAFDLANVLDLYAREYDTNSSFNFKTAGVNSRNFVWDSENTIRFDFNYSGGTRLFREFNTTVLGDVNQVRVCAAKLQNFFEVILSSNSRTPVWVKNDFANCYSLADYTKYGFQGSLIVTAYLINTPYTLYSIDTLHKTSSVLAQLDGSKVASVNLDLLEFNQKNLDFVFITDDVGFQKNGPSLIQIYYNNLKLDNTAIDFNIMDGSTNIFSFHEANNPNELTLNFNYSAIDLNSNKLHLVITATKKDGTTTTTDYYFSPGTIPVSGTIQNYVAIFFAILLVVVGLTMLSVRWVLSWFGIVVMALGIAILGLAASVWYIWLLQGIFVVIAVVFFLAAKEQKTLVN